MMRFLSLNWGGSKWLVNSPRISSLSDSPWTTPLLVFYFCCPMRGNIWTAFLNPIDCPPISSTFFPTTLLSLFYHPKPPLYLSYSQLLLILMLLLIRGDIHPNPGPTDPCSVCSRRVTWKNRSVQCINCFLWVPFSCSGLSHAEFCKISPGHTWNSPMYPSSSQPPPSHILILYLHPQTLPNPHPHPQIPTNPYLRK